MSGNDAKASGDEVKIDATLKAGSGTDAETLSKEEEAIKADGLNAKQVKELREKVSHVKNRNSVKVSFISDFFTSRIFIGPRNSQLYSFFSSSLIAGRKAHFPSRGQPNDEAYHQLAVQEQGNLLA